MSDGISKDKIIQDLEDVYTQAMAAQDFRAALAAKQAIANIFGFLPNKSNSSRKPLKLSDFTDDELNNLIKQADTLLINDEKFEKTTSEQQLSSLAPSDICKKNIPSLSSLPIDSPQNHNNSPVFCSHQSNNNDKTSHQLDNQSISPSKNHNDLPPIPATPSLNKSFTKSRAMMYTKLHANLSTYRYRKRSGFG
jgi:hypothetical protein